MEFNIAKYNVLKNQSLHFQLHTSQLHGCFLEAIDTTKYLGVYLSKDLRWNDHMQKNTNKANKTIGFLMRNLKNCSTEPRGLQLITSYQYGTVIEAITLCRLKWFRGEELAVVGSCHVTIVRTMCLICLVALDWKTLQSH